MKTLRYRIGSEIKPGILDKDDIIRDASSIVTDWDDENIKIEKLNDRFFKYRIDFDKLEIRENTAAMCVSRPTNPTGNVLTDDEMSKLFSLAELNKIPLIVDNAYGEPFPSIIFTTIQPQKFR